MAQWKGDINNREVERLVKSKSGHVEVRFKHKNSEVMGKVAVVLIVRGCGVSECRGWL